MNSKLVKVFTFWDSTKSCRFSQVRVELHTFWVFLHSQGQTPKYDKITFLRVEDTQNKASGYSLLICRRFANCASAAVVAHCSSPASSFLLPCESTLRRTFFAVQGDEEEGSRQGRKWISVPISSRAPNSDPGGISNTMFNKLMFLEVRQGYPQPLRRRHTSSVSPTGSDPKTVTGGCFNTTCVWFLLVEGLIYITLPRVTVFFCLLQCHSHFCKASGT